MGVKGLGNLVKPYGKQKTLDDFKGKTFAIDTSIYMYRFMHNADQYQFLRKFYYQIVEFEKRSIRPIYVFDGSPPQEKKDVIEKRHSTRTIEIVPEDVLELKKLFEACGVSYVVARSEAEKYCAFLNKQGYADLVLSNDYDCLVFGCRELLVLKNTGYFLFSLDEILASLQIDQSQLVDICIASGTDYYKNGIKGLGPLKGVHLAKQKGVLHNWGVSIPEDIHYETIRNIFLLSDELCDVVTCNKDEKMISSILEKCFI